MGRRQISVAPLASGHHQRWRIVWLKRKKGNFGFLEGIFFRTPEEERERDKEKNNNTRKALLEILCVSWRPSWSFLTFAHFHPVSPLFPLFVLWGGGLYLSAAAATCSAIQIDLLAIANWTEWNELIRVMNSIRMDAFVVFPNFQRPFLIIRSKGRHHHHPDVLPLTAAIFFLCSLSFCLLADLGKNQQKCFLCHHFLLKHKSLFVSSYSKNAPVVLVVNRWISTFLSFSTYIIAAWLVQVSRTFASCGTRLKGKNNITKTKTNNNNNWNWTTTRRPRKGHLSGSFLSFFRFFLYFSRSRRINKENTITISHKSSFFLFLFWGKKGTKKYKRIIFGLGELSGCRFDCKELGYGF